MDKTINKSLKSYLEGLKNYPPLSDEIVCHKIFDKENGHFVKLEIDEVLKNALLKKGIKHFYEHQAKAISLIRSGVNTVVASPTASGKTLIYNIPVFESFIKNNDSKALYLFPLKALARDQLDSVNELSLDAGLSSRLKACVYDGDTNNYQRKKIRENPPAIVLTNPDMIHLSVLPYHEKWSKLLTNLKYIIIDEVHTLRGVMGSHTAWVIKRLIRICRLYGSNPVFIFCSATIKNPVELCSLLTDLDVEAVYGTNVPKPKRNFILLNGISGASSAVTALLHAAVYRELRTIVYTKSRKMTELIALWAENKSGSFKDKIAAYRAGFLPEERREIEQRLSLGDLLAVVSTSALELGIDIGSLDICILFGYPGSINSTWQRAGRVGRGGNEACVILVGGEDALDQYIMRNPDAFFEMEPEPAVIFPENPYIAKKHLVSMASELPIDKSEIEKTDSVIFKYRDLFLALVENGELLQSEETEFYFSPQKYPQRGISLRGSDYQYKIIDVLSNTLIGEIDSVRVFHEAHPGAVYLHKGEYYLIVDLDENERIVKAEKRHIHYYTKYNSEKTTSIIEVYKTKKVFNANLGFGKVKVTEKISGYEKRLIRGQKFIGKEVLDLPPIEFETQGLWIEFPVWVYEHIRDLKKHFMGGIHAVEHASIGIFPTVVMCDRNDIGGISTVFHPQIKKPAVFIYDGYSGGAGLTRKAFEEFEELLKKTYKMIVSCPCDEGCPACIHSPKCGSGNRPLDKDAAIEILTALFKNKLEDTKPFFIEPPKKKTEIKSLEPVKSYCVLDIETRYSASEVGGWMNAHKMEVSCLVLYDSILDDYLTYYAQDMPKLVEDLKKYDLVVGFNIIRFDYKVLTGYLDFKFSSLNTLDILESVQEKLNYRLSLDHLSEHTLNAQKGGSGLDALKWWREGKIDKIVKYCKKDVELTKDLYLFGKKNGYLIFRNKAKDKVRVPVSF